MSDKQAFFEVVKDATPAREVVDATPARASYVSLYVDLPFYGGPEEGGWWGSDTELVAYHLCSNDAEAEAIRNQVHALAETLSSNARDAFGNQCRAECEWLEARGLDADFLPEVDGEQRYFVAVEDRPGTQVHHGTHFYA